MRFLLPPAAEQAKAPHRYPDLYGAHAAAEAGLGVPLAAAAVAASLLAEESKCGTCAVADTDEGAAAAPA